LVTVVSAHAWLVAASTPTEQKVSSSALALVIFFIIVALFVLGFCLLLAVI
jgi:hypothetical protein